MDDTANERIELAPGFDIPATGTITKSKTGSMTTISTQGAGTYSVTPQASPMSTTTPDEWRRLDMDDPLVQRLYHAMEKFCFLADPSDLDPAVEAIYGQMYTSAFTNVQLNLDFAYLDETGSIARFVDGTWKIVTPLSLALRMYYHMKHESPEALQAMLARQEAEQPSLTTWMYSDSERAAKTADTTADTTAE